MNNCFPYPTTLMMDVRGKYEYDREPVLRRMPDGSLISFALSGGAREPEIDNLVLTVRSTDNGYSWSEPEVAFSHSARAAWTTEVFTDGMSAPMLFVQTYLPESRYRELQTFVSVTRDAGITWSEPVSLSGANGVCVRQGIRLASGRIVFPVYWQECRQYWDWQGLPEEETMNNAVWPKKCGVMISDDNGLSFRRFGNLSAEFLLWENNIVEWGKNHLIMLMRAERAGCLYRSESFDGGVSWQSAQPTDIPGAGSKISMIRIGDNIILVHNANEHRGATGFHSRIKLEAWVSDDGLKTFRRKIPLCDPEALFFYPHLEKDEGGGQLLIAFENGMQHYLTRVPYEELFG